MKLDRFGMDSLIESRCYVRVTTITNFSDSYIRLVVVKKRQLSTEVIFIQHSLESWKWVKPEPHTHKEKYKNNNNLVIKQLTEANNCRRQMWT